MPNDLENKPEKKPKLSLAEFVDENQKILSVAGVFAALTLFGNNLSIADIGKMLSFATLGITLLLVIEVCRKVPLDLTNDVEIPLTVFLMFLIICAFCILLNWLVGFKEFWRPLMPAALMLPVAWLMIFLMKKTVKFLGRFAFIRNILQNKLPPFLTNSMRRLFRKKGVQLICIPIFIIMFFAPIGIVSSVLSFYIMKGIDAFDERPAVQPQVTVLSANAKTAVGVTNHSINKYLNATNQFVPLNNISEHEKKPNMAD